MRDGVARRPLLLASSYRGTTVLCDFYANFIQTYGNTATRRYMAKLKKTPKRNFGLQ
jgi:hypothetical protein